MVALGLRARRVGIEGKLRPDKKEAARREHETAEDVDHVMLMRQERGKTDQANQPRTAMRVGPRRFRA